MKRNQKGGMPQRALSFVLAFAVWFSGLSLAPAGDVEVQAASNVISISSAKELAKIGKDASYPMDGDYVLTSNIDLGSEGNWTPIGGANGPEYALVEGERVFSGTFDGAGHVIEGLTITYDGSAGSQKSNASGLFAMIGSVSAQDYAEVKNLNFTDVSITHTLGRGDIIGTLAGDVNGYAKINNVAVLSGSINIKGSSGGDLIGVGGIVGQTRTNTQKVEMTNLYNAAMVTVENSVANTQERCGGILGRIHQQGVIGSLSSCVNVGEVWFKGSAGYAINGYSSSQDAQANTANISNCYYITGKDFGSSSAVSEEELSGETVLNALEPEYWSVYNGKLMLVISQGKVVTPIPLPQFAEGDSMSSVTKSFTVPLVYVSEEGEESITWTSGNPSVISIDPASGAATVEGVLADTAVTLNAVTSVSKRTRTVTVTVRSELTVTVDKEYVKPGAAMTASVERAPEGTEFSYTWKVGGVIKARTASYTPDTSALNQFVEVTAELNGNMVGQKRMYCSKLPVVYIDTNDGAGIYDKQNYKGAVMHVQGNDTFNGATTTLYDGGISIRGRGNSTWNTSFNKLPYKLKLDEKTDLFGFGKSKHWALLANYMDESLIRNTTSYDLAGKMGIEPYLKSTHVELILNGVYSGNYQFVGNVRIDTGRVEIYDWEDLAGDVAKAIGKQEGISGDARDAFEDYLNEHMQWITSDSVTYQGKAYKISDYFTEIPKNPDGSVNLSGGFLFELDEYYDEASKFRTQKGLPMMFKSPEFISTNNELFSSAQNFIQAVEDSVWSSDFYTTYNGERKHYTDLVDMDSLVNYLIINEFYWNTETMKKSSFMYKDLDGKLMIGPLWDMDWTSNSIVSSSETNKPYVWMIKDRGSSTQTQKVSWYLALIRDPYFVRKMYESYTKNREYFGEIVETGGIIDQDIEYLRESGEANYNGHFMQSLSPFVTEAERLRTFLKTRLSWLDQQFKTPETLLSSLGGFKASGSISVTADTSDAAATSYTASVTDSSAKKVGFYINGILAGTADIAGGKAVLTASDRFLDQTEGAVNIVQVRALDASGTPLSSGSVTNYISFTKEVKAEALTGTASVRGRVRAGSVLTAEFGNTNSTGTIFYQWKADGADIAGAVEAQFLLTEAQVGKRISVEITSSDKSGSVVSEETEPAAALELKNDHIIINQVYGGGANDGTPVSHSFIELYNPTDKDISLDGYSVGYMSGGKNGPALEEVVLPLENKTVPSHASYLIRCEAQADTTPELIKLRIDKFDQEWDQAIDNKRYQIILYHGDEAEDGVSVNENPVEGFALSDGTISKQKAIRRKKFVDTDSNTADFEAVSYRDETAQVIEQKRPRCLEDGAWGTGGDEPDELSGSLSIRGNALLGAILYADDATNNTGEISYQWKADGADIAGASGQFLAVGESLKDKLISVTVTSSVETGSMTAAMERAVREGKAQNGHVIIHQVYGGGGKGKTPISHSFIELYNPTPKDVNLDGYRISYLSDGTQEELALSGTICSGASYLIQCAPEQDATGVVTISDPDCVWDLTIANKRYSVLLKNKDTNVDGVSVNEAPVEGTALVNPEDDEIISKNKSIRRIAFIDTDDNAADFEVLNYSKLPEELLAGVVPRRGSDGAWGLAIEPDQPDEQLIQQAQEAVLNAAAKEKDKYTADSYKVLEAALQEVKNILESPDATADGLQKALANLQKAIDGLKEKTPEGPGVNPGPVENPGGNPPSETITVKAGDKYRMGKGWYKVTKVTAAGGTVTYEKPVKKNYTSVSVPPTVKIQGKTFQVTAVSAKALKGNKKLSKVTLGKNITRIGNSAFEGCGKLKKITVNSKVLKNVGKNALKGVHSNCKIKVPKQKLSLYTRLFRKKGQKTGVKVVK